MEKGPDKKPASHSSSVTCLRAVASSGLAFLGFATIAALKSGAASLKHSGVILANRTLASKHAGLGESPTRCEPPGRILESEGNRAIQGPAHNLKGEGVQRVGLSDASLVRAARRQGRQTESEEMRL